MRWNAAQVWEEEWGDGGLGYCDAGDKPGVCSLEYVVGHGYLQMLALLTAVLYLITGYLSSTGDGDR
jgi:hypothetical protein